MIKNLQLPSNDGIHKLHVAVWEPEQPVKAVLQISHGMIEFIERYDGFANYLNKRGIAVIGNDHLGHGQTAGCDDDLGYFCPREMSRTVVDDLHTVTEYAKKEFSGVPYFLLGHSMGSFMARRYLMTYGDELTGAILLGTGRKPAFVLRSGKLVANVIGAVFGQHYRTRLLKKLAFGTSNKRVNPVRTENDWLTHDEAVVDWYNSNKYCTFSFTVNGYKTLFEVLSFIQKEENINKIPKDLPILMTAGADDPVGEYGKGVTAIYEQYRNKGIQDISLKLYQGDRHEILNELDKETVYDDIAKWLEKYMG